MRKQCSVCEEPFEAKRSAAKYCGERCKKRAQRRPGTVVQLPTGLGGAGDGPMVAATRAGLEEANRAGSELGAGALFLAARLDAVGMSDTGAGVAALMKEWRATLAEAVKDADRADDPLDSIRQSAALKLIAG